MSRPLSAALWDEACLPYRKAGSFAYFFARSKFRRDPVYQALLEQGLLVGRARILDLGCGQALLSASLRAAARSVDLGFWPADWPSAPRPASIRGIELKPRDVERARAALGADLDIATGDIRRIDFGSVDAVVLLDVLHYMSRDAQRALLERVRRALPPAGLLLLRICDAGAGLRYRCTQWVDRIAMLIRGHRSVRPHRRSLVEWCTLLQDCGFICEARPMSQGTPFANVLLVAHAAGPEARMSS